MEPTSKYIEANGFTHHYLDWGNERAQPVLMTHGIGLCAQIWNHAARTLSADYHILSLGNGVVQCILNYYHNGIVKYYKFLPAAGDFFFEIWCL